MIYLASPYSGNEEQNFKHATNACRIYFNHRMPVFSPIAHWHPIATEYSLGKTADYYAEQNASGVEHCSEMHILMVPGYDESIGIAKEIGWARLHGKKVCLVAVDDVTVTEKFVLNDDDTCRWLDNFGIKY